MTGPDVVDDEECREEVWSWDYFSAQAVDGYWIRCGLLGSHLEHEDSHTGLTWKAKVTP